MVAVKTISSKGCDKHVVPNATSFDPKGFSKYKRQTIKSLQVVPHNRALFKDWNGHAILLYTCINTSLKEARKLS